MFWMAFSHAVRISSAEFFSPYVNMEFPRDLNIPDLAFYLMEVACCNLPAYIPLPLPYILLLPETSTLPEPPLPLPTEIDCRQLYQPDFILDQRSLNLKFQSSSLLGLINLINL